MFFCLAHGPGLAQELREVALLRERCRFSRAKIELDGAPVSVGHRFALHVELDPERPAFSSNARKVRSVELDGRAIGCAGFRYAQAAPAEVWILTNGVLAERFELGDEQRVAARNFGAIVELDLPKDLSQSKLAHGPEYERVIAAIWATHDRLAPTPQAGLQAIDSPGALASTSPMVLAGAFFAVLMIGLVMFVSGSVLFTGLGVAILVVSTGVVLLREPRDNEHA